MRRRPGFTAIIIITLALGIGANTAIFSVVDAVLLRPLPIKDPDKVIRIYETFLPSGWGTVSAPNFRDWRARNTVFEHLSAYSFRSYNLQRGDNPVRIPGAAVTADYFDTMGVQPEMGRPFLAGEDKAGNEHVAVISDLMWRKDLGSDPNVIGKGINLGGETYTVVGVMPSKFLFPSQSSEIWVPLVLPDEKAAPRGNHQFFVIGRLRPDVTRTQATEQMKGIARQLASEYPDDQTGRSVLLNELKDDTIKHARPTLLVLMGAVLAVLLICCVNIASLLLTNASARHRETAVRAALGASRWRMIRQFLAESMLLSLLGGAAGALLAQPVLKSIMALAVSALPRSSEVGLDFRILAFTFLLSLLTGVAFGTLPALQASRADVREALSDGSRGSSGGTGRLRQALVICEVALSLALLIAAGLMIKSFTRLQAVNSGLNPDNVITMTIALPDARYPTEESVTGFFENLLQKVQAVPGVDSAGLISALPMQEWGINGDFGIVGRPPDAPGSAPFAEYRTVSEKYFTSLRIPLIAGRFFNPRDTAKSQPVVVVNQALAERYFPGESVLGKALEFAGPPATIVGVTGDVRQSGLALPVMPTIFIPHTQAPDKVDQTMVLVVRGKMDPGSLVPGVRSQVLAVDSMQPVFNVKSMTDVISGSMQDSRLNTVLLSIFAGLALLLGAIGIYGVVSYAVAQRTHEIGIRMALGALPKDVKLMALKQGASLAVIGAALGLGLSFALTRTLSSLLFSVSAVDPVAYGVMAALLLFMTLAACYIPARRAARVDPMDCLRYQ